MLRGMGDAVGLKQKKRRKEKKMDNNGYQFQKHNDFNLNEFIYCW
jgi:hypothetical protein